MIYCYLGRLEFNLSPKEFSASFSCFPILVGKWRLYGRYSCLKDKKKFLLRTVLSVLFINKKKKNGFRISLFTFFIIFLDLTPYTYVICCFVCMFFVLNKIMLSLHRKQENFRQIKSFSLKFFIVIKRLDVILLNRSKSMGYTHG